MSKPERKNALQALIDGCVDRDELTDWIHLIWERQMELDVERLGSEEFMQRLTAEPKDEKQEAALAIMNLARFASDADREVVLDAVGRLLGRPL